MSLEKLQHELIEKINNIIIESDDDIVKNDKEKALEIINELKDHINDKIKVSNNLKMTVLECIIRCDSQGNVRLNNRSLMDLEEAVKKIGGKTSYIRECLGQEEDLIPALFVGLLGVVGATGLAILFVYMGEIAMAATSAVGALVLLVISIYCLYSLIKGNSTSTNLDSTTTEQHTQGTESTLRA